MKKTFASSLEGITLFLFLVFFNGNSFAQKNKVPLRPFSSTHTIYDSCQVVCNLFPANREYLIATEKLVFQGITDNSECYKVPENFNPGCLLSYDNSKWFLVKVLSGDTLNFNFLNSKNYDIDAAVWGPIDGANLDSTCHATSNFPASCDYSTTEPKLSLYQPDFGSYYILAITNYSNSSTDILLSQPEGGEVMYSYFCPENAQLTYAISGNQNIQAISKLALSQGINSSSKVSAIGGNSIELLPGFETDSSTVFNALIGQCINTSQDYSPESSNIACENFFNHTRNSPHLYTNVTSNEVVATVFAKTQPEIAPYNGHYTKMSKIGIDKDSDRFLWAYREPYLNPTNTHLRTNENCPAYADVRLIHTQPTYREEVPLPDLEPIENYFNINSPFYLSNNLKADKTTFDLWNFYLKQDVTNLLYRINGGSWTSGIAYGPILEDYSDRVLNVTKIKHMRVPKDFILDFTVDDGVSIDRYLVTRNSCGGHFCGTTVFNRVADSTVIVSVFQGDINVNMQLGEFNSFRGFGPCFNLGEMEEGTYTYPLQSQKGDFVLDDEIFVHVKFY
ncbi:MAG: hypothetical protein ACI9QN_002521 [Arcticibacterium sp.]